MWTERLSLLQDLASGTRKDLHDVRLRNDANSGGHGIAKGSRHGQAGRV